jgi:hypothetical protein
VSYSFTTGQDCTIDITNNKTGATYSFNNVGGDLLHFEGDWDIEVIRRRPISNKGLVKRRTDYKGCKGSIEIGRINADFEKLELSQQDNYRQGGDPISFTIHQSIRESDGSGKFASYQYTNCTLWTSKSGSYQMGEDVKITMEFEGDDIVANP